MKSMAANKLQTLFYNKFFWQLILAVFMLAMAIFFIRHEHVELLEIKDRFRDVNMFYLFLGIMLTIVYTMLHAVMYVYSFRAIGSRVTLLNCLQLFLRRNLVSVFLPAGGFSSLAFFSKNIESEKTSKSQIHLASTIYGIVGILSVVIVAIPIFSMAFLKGQLHQAEIFSLAFIILLSFALILGFVSFIKKGRVFRVVEKRNPKLAALFTEISANDIQRKHIFNTIYASVLIEIVGICHLYISMLALGFEPSLVASMIGYVVMIVLLIASPLLRGLGAIEVSLTFILTQYGFPILAAASITLLFRLFEFWIPLFMGIVSFISHRDNLVLRVLPAFLLLTLGITNIISAITPAIPSRMLLVESILPPEMITTSNGLIMVSGLLLILLAIFLLQGSKRAWIAALMLTSLSVLGHLAKAGDFEEAILSLVVIAVLVYTKSFYILKPHPKFTRLSFKVILFGLIAILLYGVLGFYFMDKEHFGVEFVLTDAINEVLKLFFLFEGSSFEPLTPFGQNFIYSFYTANALYFVFVVVGFLSPYFSQPFNSDQDRALVTQLAVQYGHSALDYFKIYPDKMFFITKNKQAFVSFRISRHFAVVLEDPIAPDTETMQMAIVEFDNYCKENGFVPVYYRVPEKNLPIYSSLNKKSFPVGEVAVLNLTNFTIDGGKMKPTRSAINRLTGEGFIFKTHKPPIKEGLMQKLELVSDQWLGAMGKKEISFSQGVFDKSILKNQTIFTIENSEEMVYAFLNLVPVYEKGLTTYDLIRKINDAPNGVLDMLLCKTFLFLKEVGYEKIDLGLAPMSGMSGNDLKEKAVSFAYENLRSFDNYKGLRKYKEKFYPEWHKTYLVYDHDYHLFQVPVALRKVSEPL